jgi:hypothetical protein
MKTVTEPETPFQKFKQLTERLLAVPKKELDQKLDENKQARKRKKQHKNNGGKSR